MNFIDAKRFLRKCLSGFFLVTLFLRSMTGYAVERGDECSDMPCSMTIQLEDLGTRPDHTVFEVYQVGVAEVDQEVQFRLLDRYRNTGLTLEPSVFAEKQEETVIKLIKAVEKSTPVREEKADENGVLQMENLDQGVYLVKQKDIADYGKVAPFLVFLPYETEGKREYNLIISPKAERVEEAQTDIPIVWSQGNVQAAATGEVVRGNLYAALWGASVLIMIFMSRRGRKE